MPTYEFYCKKCDDITDLFCVFKRRPKSITCKGCGARAQYQISAGTRPLNGGTPIFHRGKKGETFGDLFDKGGVDIGSKENKAANKKHIEKMRKKNDKS